VTKDSESLARFERNLGRLLMTAVVVSASTLAAGLVLFLLSPHSVAAARFLTAGLFMLMATPVLRVTVSIAEYVRMRDWVFVITTVIVLIQLTITFVLAFHRGSLPGS
jgi:uncharacterized membrane protein